MLIQFVSLVRALTQNPQSRVDQLRNDWRLRTTTNLLRHWRISADHLGQKSLWSCIRDLIVAQVWWVPFLRSHLKLHSLPLQYCQLRNPNLISDPDTSFLQQVQTVSNLEPWKLNITIPQEQLQRRRLNNNGRSKILSMCHWRKDSRWLSFEHSCQSRDRSTHTTERKNRWRDGNEVGEGEDGDGGEEVAVGQRRRSLGRWRRMRNWRNHGI